MLVTITREKALGDAETGKTGENDKNSKNGNKDLGVNFS